ncbi:MAG: hypothetical protein K2H85_06750 [Allobaculum sp.]|nr:hypothetical protein [Allobaculum sp.]
MELVKMLLEDLGLYGYTPATFPELVIFIVSFVVGAAFVSGTVKTILILCFHFSDGGLKW